MSHSLDSELYDDWRHQACRAEAAALRARVAELEAKLMAVGAVLQILEAADPVGMAGTEGPSAVIRAAIGDPSPYLAEYRIRAAREAVQSLCERIPGLREQITDLAIDDYIAARADEPVDERRTRDTEPANPRQPDATREERDAARARVAELEAKLAAVEALCDNQGADGYVMAHALRKTVGDPSPYLQDYLDARLSDGSLEAQGFLAEYRNKVLRKAADRLPYDTEGADRIGTSTWPEEHRDVYSLAIEEAQAAIRARADVDERRTRDTEPANPRQPDAEAAHKTSPGEHDGSGSGQDPCVSPIPHEVAAASPGEHGTDPVTGKRFTSAKAAELFGRLHPRPDAEAAHSEEQRQCRSQRRYFPQNVCSTLPLHSEDEPHSDGTYQWGGR